MATEKAIFAGGCFWCMVQPFEERDGILTVTSGYTGGDFEFPTYEQVKQHVTGHTEAVEIIFDNEKVNYSDLVELYWQTTDPTDAFGQFEDRGDNYRPVIFYTNEQQRILAEQSKATLQASGRFDEDIVTKIEPAKTFWPAEAYHQGFYRTHPKEYKEEIQDRRAFILEHWTKKNKM
ncbi:peptide-methionine (S)-S-oxide reductase MsrA [Lactococcus fujiensis]|uniref:Peptide methionine sulfoxide reductase MsrA n=1 Tax=Lactococcus fujiensis JCM 16395 TaxID=1291764 RepID=A0A2A5RKM1_9LACT|nr:peptide-methionine (S)-S-oxide reductase MsrA [Lactococcus fujiensis]PCR99776.1 methionine sulfoxide reductase A [Lactococcus fujiensis JCM 16395]